MILGIDPGSRVTGYGLIERKQSKLIYVASGCIRTSEGPLDQRLLTIFQGVSQIIQQFSPCEFAIEEVFVAKNAGSALKLGQARGAAIVAAANHGLPVFEYAARKVKQAVVGNGAAEKAQVSMMVSSLLKLNKSPQSDAADALAIAICHANTGRVIERASVGKKHRKGRYLG